MSIIDEAYIQKLLRTVNHDMSAALRSSVGFSSLILAKYDNQLDEKAKYWLSLNVEQGKKTQADLIALSEYARLYNIGEAESQCDLEALAVKARDRLSLGAINVDIALSASISGHPSLWEGCFYELIHNSCLHSGGSQCVIYERNVGAQLQILVEDNGIGLDDAKAAEALLPFRSFGEKAGVGLGLARVKRIAEIHHGQLRLSSGERGLCVEISLPANVVCG